MKIFDISMAIHGDMTVYKNKAEKKPNLKVMQDFLTSSAYESRLEMDMHTGTHIDAPLHMMENGDTIDHFDLSKAYGKCRVIDLTKVKEKITKEDLLSKDIRSGEYILFKTRNSFTEEFDFDFVYLEISGAEYLKDIGIIGVGTDALGIERAQSGHETHKLLLGNSITILEGLRLKDIEEGEYILVAAPLKIIGAEASPARALLIKE